MQDITPIVDEKIKIIESYGGGGFKISGNRVDNSVFIFRDYFHKIDKSNIETITRQDISDLEEIEILLVGYGEESEFLPSSLEQDIKNAGVSIEYMNTGAAARTYNILVSEERKVATILIAV